MPKYYKCIESFPVIFNDTKQRIIIEQGEIYELRNFDFFGSSLKRVKDGN